jgi:hypothetical protein
MTKRYFERRNSRSSPAALSFTGKDLIYWCAAEIFAIQISSRWHGTPLPHGVGVTFKMPASVPLEFGVAPVTAARMNKLHTPAFESVLSHCQLFAVFAPSVSV